MNSQLPSPASPASNEAFPKRSVSKTPPTALPWMNWRVGERVVVRRREADGLYDALGELLEVCPDHVTVQTRKGPVRIEAHKMVTGKRVPPAPQL